MSTKYWSMDSWGNGYPPINADEVICAANAIIDEYIAAHPDDEYGLEAFSEQLWETFCETGTIGDVRACFENLDSDLYDEDSEAYDGTHDWSAFTSYRTSKVFRDGASVVLNGYPVNFDACVALMDDDIREKLHAEGLENEQDFLDRYVALHAAKYGEKFGI